MYSREVVVRLFHASSLTVGQVMSLVAQARIEGFDNPEAIARNQAEMRRALGAHTSREDLGLR